MRATTSGGIINCKIWDIETLILLYQRFTLLGYGYIRRVSLFSFPGHSTKGEHNIHKLNEYMKKHSFYDEQHDGGQHAKHGGFSESHAHVKGKKAKSGSREGKHEAGERGKKGLVNRGKQYEDYEKEGRREGKKQHRAERKEWGEEGGKKRGEKWGEEERR